MYLPLIIIKLKVDIILNKLVEQAVQVTSQAAQVVVVKKLPTAQTEHVVAAANNKIKNKNKYT